MARALSVRRKQDRATRAWLISERAKMRAWEIRSHPSAWSSDPFFALACTVLEHIQKHIGVTGPFGGECAVCLEEMHDDTGPLQIACCQVLIHRECLVTALACDLERSENTKAKCPCCHMNFKPRHIPFWHWLTWLECEGLYQGCWHGALYGLLQAFRRTRLAML